MRNPHEALVIDGASVNGVSHCARVRRGSQSSNFSQANASLARAATRCFVCQGSKIVSPKGKAIPCPACRREAFYQAIEEPVAVVFKKASEEDAS